ncbi:hypothetical protein J3R30DRAFT_3404647 [Lentinula aciculospora]|uniref:Uncharacterized protein n=1 Tax=Lentinula aciculospora TaxID=153920 RepID=A0A9W9A9Y0_9AGAR|nr:hypothetical protein J3R30DRAFT_3404647 [Lentinula aciculospora]
MLSKTSLLLFFLPIPTQPLTITQSKSPLSLRIMSSDLRLSCTVSSEVPESNPTSQPGSVTGPAQPSIFTLMLRTPYIPPSSTNVKSLLHDPADIHLEKFKESDNEKLSETGTELNENASVDNLFRTLRTLPTISSNDLYFSPSSGWDNINS